MYQVYSRADLLRLGCSDRIIRAAVGCCLERIGHGVFAVSGECDQRTHRRIWEPLGEPDIDPLSQVGDVRDRIDRTKVLIRAATDRGRRRPSVDVASGESAESAESGRSGAVAVFSHLSAALLWQFAITRMEKPTIEIISPTSSRRSSVTVVRRRVVASAQIVRLGDVVLTSKERTLVDVARDYDLDVSVPMLDDALRRLVVTADSLGAAFAECAEVRGRGRVGKALVLADPRRESVGESIVAVRLDEVDVVGFEPQGLIIDENGMFVARVDFLHEASKTILEFDGRMKYSLDGKDARREFDKERERERRLRALGYHVVRIFWKDLWARAKFTEIARLVASRMPSTPRV